MVGECDPLEFQDPWGKKSAGSTSSKGSRNIVRDQIKIFSLFAGGGGGRGSSGGGGRGSSGGGGDNNEFSPVPGAKGVISLVVALVLILWATSSVYTVRPDEAAVVLTFGKYHQTEGPGIHVAAWPIQKAYIFPVTRENSVDIGFGVRPTVDGILSDPSEVAREGIMLTGDENIIDVDYQVVWNIKNPADFLFNLAEPQTTIKAVAESAMREVVGRSELKPMLNRDRAQVAEDVKISLQKTLDSYSSGVNIVRVNFDKADPPLAVIDSFRDVQAAAQERDTLKKQAEAYANTRLAEARGEAAQIVEEAESYSARVVKDAEGTAERFLEIVKEYKNSPRVTRERLYIETVEKVLKNNEKIIIDGDISKGGIIPYLPLNDIGKMKK